MEMGDATSTVIDGIQFDYKIFTHFDKVHFHELDNVLRITGCDGSDFNVRHVVGWMMRRQ